MNEYYIAYAEAIAARDRDTLYMLAVCLSAVIAYLIARAMGRTIHYTVTGILAAAFATLFIQGLLEVIR